MNASKTATTLLASLTLCMASAALAQSNPPQEKKPVTIKTVRVEDTRKVDGATLFKAYCAVCHGVNGTGDGPAAAALKTKPADLTMLSKKHGGKFPWAEMTSYITGEDTVAAHGSRDMPIWGEIFSSLSPTNTDMLKLRMSALLDYVARMQIK